MQHTFYSSTENRIIFAIQKGIDITLEEVRKGKVTKYKNTEELFKKVFGDI